MVESLFEHLLVFARVLQHAASFEELLEATREEARKIVGYNHAWFMVADDEQLEELRLIDISSAKHRQRVWEVAPVLKVKGDQFLEALVASDSPVVIEDARLDPRTNKETVEKLQNRTLINIPLRLLDKPFGIVGFGTFGEEGCRPPDPAQLDYLVGMASQIVVAASRIRFVEVQARAEKDRREFERRLMQSQKLESLGMLAGGIAHDFNNLLTVITVSSALAEEMAEKPEIKAEIKSIRAAAMRAEGLTRQLLAMSRSQELHLKALDMNVQVRQLLQLARRVLPETIEIDSRYGSGLPMIEADAPQVDQVLMNLMINARDAMPKGGRIALETQQVVINDRYAETHAWAKPGRYVLLTVTHTGTGMSKEVQDRIFEPFFTTKGPRVGTGLGLAVTYGIIRQHPGIIQCYSEVGIGTTFKIYLPAAEMLAEDVGPRLKRPSPRGNELVLVAEDDEFVRAAAVRILEKAGYHVNAVEDGDAACRAIADASYGLVILDVVMPGMECREVVERIRALHPNTPIVLSSGYTAGNNAVALAKQTGLELLSKPYDPDRMLLTVRAALDTGSSFPPQN